MLAELNSFMFHARSSYQCDTLKIKQSACMSWWQKSMTDIVSCISRAMCRCGVWGMVGCVPALGWITRAWECMCRCNSTDTNRQYHKWTKTKGKQCGNTLHPPNHCSISCLHSVMMAGKRSAAGNSYWCSTTWIAGLHTLPRNTYSRSDR